VVRNKNSASNQSQVRKDDGCRLVTQKESLPAVILLKECREGCT